MTDEEYKACTPRERFIYDLTQKWKTYVGSRGAQLSFETNFDELLKEFRDNFQKMEESTIVEHLQNFLPNVAYYINRYFMKFRSIFETE